MDNIKTINPQNIPDKIDFKILDGLRGIAAMYVVINHCRGTLFMGGAKYAAIKPVAQWDITEKIFFALLRLTSLGKEFVILFFVLSGFSIAYSISKTDSIKDFYVRRFIRLYPPYIVALVWAFIIFQLLFYFAPILLPVDAESVFSSFKTTAKNLFYIDTGSLIVQFWSLKFEVIFYLLIPLFILKRNWYLACSAIIAVLAFIIPNHYFKENPVIMDYIFAYNIFFAIGVFCFHFYKKVAQVFVFKNKKLFYSMALLFFIAIVVFDFKFNTNLKSGLFQQWLAGLFSVTLLFNFLYHNIKTKALMFLGNISYSIYISHYASLLLLLFVLLKTGGINGIEIQYKFLWLLGIPFSIGISYLFYLLIENRTKEMLVKMRG